MSDDGWKSIVASLAPTVATVLGGPMAGMGVSVLSKMVLGRDGSGNEKTDLAEIGQAILTGGTEVLQKVKDSEVEILRIESEMGVRLAEIHAGDRDSARNREIETGDNMTATIAIIVVVGFFASAGWLFSGYVKLEGQTGAIIGTMVGYISAKAEQVITYYFGSSKGSSKKNLMISSLMQKVKTTAGKF